MSVLVDTSVWIEFFRQRSSLAPEDGARLAESIREDEVVTIAPIRAEVLSGRPSATQATEIADVFGALHAIDLDWNARGTWDDVVALARAAHEARLAVPGLVDRMVLAAAISADAVIWTLDPALRRLAAHVKHPLV